MKKGLVAGILVVLALAAIIAIALKSHATGSTISNLNTQTTAGSSSSVKFTNSPYYGYSYPISGDSLSSQAQKAITGFKLGKATNSDGTTTYTLTALESGYQNQTYTLQSGQSLYFIERSIGDDDTTGNTDYNLGDDFAVVVNSNGNIAQ